MKRITVKTTQIHIPEMQAEEDTLQRLLQNRQTYVRYYLPDYRDYSTRNAYVNALKERREDLERDIYYTLPRVPLGGTLWLAEPLKSQIHAEEMSVHLITRILEEFSKRITGAEEYWSMQTAGRLGSKIAEWEMQLTNDSSISTRASRAEELKKK